MFQQAYLWDIYRIEWLQYDLQNVNGQ